MFLYLVKNLSTLTCFVEIWAVCTIGSWKPKICPPSVPRLKYCRWDTYAIKNFPRSIAAQCSRRFNFLVFVKPCIFKLFIVNSANFLTFSRAVVHISFINWFGGKMTWSGCASRSISIEMPSFASFANFRIFFQSSHLKGGSSVGLYQNGSVPRKVRSFGADSTMWYILL